MSRFGPLREYDFDDKQDQLWEWLNNGGCGVMGFDKVPVECMDFCLEQYARFNIPVPQELIPAVTAAASTPFFLVDHVDPYSLFHGGSDVNITMEWSDYAYEVKDEYTGRFYEASPEYFETFVYAPHQGEEYFNHLLSHPGLESIRDHNELSELLFGDDYGEGCINSLDSEDRMALTSHFTLADGVVDWDRINAFCKLAAWASYAWLIGPLSREYRMSMLDIFYVAITHGECIMLDGCIISPENYRKLPRAPLSCHKCGVAAWCIEMCMIDRGSRYICEHCLSEGMKVTGMATCGSKRCMLTECQHHPYHHLGSGGIKQYMRDHGQLRAAANGQTATRILGPGRA